MKKRILICGGREFADSAMVASAMAYLETFIDPQYCIIQGGAKGADRLAGDYAKLKGRPCIVMYANWDVYGKRAGTLRNTWMLNYAGPDLVVAFPGGRGTADMIKQARGAGIDVWEVK